MKETKEGSKFADALEQAKDLQTRALIRSEIVIVAPEIYYTNPTPEQEKHAEERYKNLYASGKNRIPNGVDTYYGKVMFIEDDNNFLFLLTPALGANETVGGFFGRLFALREEAIKKLMNLSPEGIAELRAKATKLQTSRPSVLNNLAKP